MMRSARLASVALAAVLPTFLFVQEPKDQRRIVTVEGCVQKSWLKVIEGESVPFSRHIDRYHLHGPKDLMKTLTKDLNGHDVEVTGALTDPDDTQGRGKTIQLGKKTTIYTNARESSDVPPLIDPTIEVSSFRDVRETCNK